MNFRKDLNGLRAIAVIVVVLFHFNASWMLGGFAGVDVFFVISGFLMTGIIFRGLEQDNFSIMKFYIARANRIIPTLAMLCLVLLLLGWFYLPPLEYKTLGKHVVSSLTFFSNFTYMSEAGYFDTASHEKWLLHTWSLSVEWQFYLIYPLALFFLSKFLSFNALKVFILIGTVIGFVFCFVATYKWPNPSYYLLPTRAWEMMLGGVAYLYPIAVKETRKKLVELIGLILIIGSCFLISKTNPWPGFLALIPVLGAFLLIQANLQNSNITGNFFFQKIGEWSYSIYLWHWPLVVVIYYYSLGGFFVYAGIAFSFLLGFLSSKYIEKFKFRNDFSSLISYVKCKPIFYAFITLVFGYSIILSNGYSGRLNTYESMVLNYSDSLLHDYRYKELTQGCELKNMHLSALCSKLDNLSSKPSAIVLGDSHATAIAPGVNDSLLRIKNNGQIVNVGAYGCIPMLDVKHTDNDRILCSEYNKKTFDIIKNKFSGVPIIILSRFNLYTLGFNEKGETQKPYVYISQKEFNDQYLSDYESSFIRSMCHLSSKNPVYILKPLPEFGFSIPKRMLLNSMSNLSYQTQISQEQYNDRNEFFNELLGKVEKICNVTVLDANSKFFQDGFYTGVIDGKPLYVDDNHLNLFGANYISSVFDEIW